MSHERRAVTGDNAGVTALLKRARTVASRWSRNGLERLLLPLASDPPTRVGSQAALGDVRAVCQRCGAHAMATVLRATMSVSGTCGICGSYELELIDL